MYTDSELSNLSIKRDCVGVCVYVSVYVCLCVPVCVSCVQFAVALSIILILEIAAAITAFVLSSQVNNISTVITRTHAHLCVPLKHCKQLITLVLSCAAQRP